MSKECLRENCPFFDDSPGSPQYCRFAEWREKQWSTGRDDYPAPCEEDEE